MSLVLIGRDTKIREEKKNKRQNENAPHTSKQTVKINCTENSNNKDLYDMFCLTVIYIL